MNFLQSDAWVEFQKSLGRKVFDIAGAKVIQHDLPFGKNYLYIPYGPEVASYQFAGELKQLAQQEGSIFVKAEPMHDDIAQELVKIGFRRSAKTIQPHKTIVLDLTKSEDELLSAMHHKTRYNINLAERKGIVVREGGSIDDFWRLMQKTSKRDQFSSYPKSYYEKLLKFTTLTTAYHDDIPVASAMILMHEKNAYYLHGASDHAFRHLMAPYALHWHIALNLKRLNFKLYDLWGIDAQRWPGVTRFKLGWGGRTVEYPGAFDLTTNSFWKTAYDMLSVWRTR